jgi:hypothetical protein
MWCAPGKQKSERRFKEVLRHSPPFTIIPANTILATPSGKLVFRQQSIKPRKENIMPAKAKAKKPAPKKKAAAKKKK